MNADSAFGGTIHRHAPASGSKPIDSPSLDIDELRLIADAMNGINHQLVVDEWLWDLYVKGQHLRYNVYDAICCNRLDLKWGVDGLYLLDKLAALPYEGRALLVLGLAEFWNRCDETNAESVFERLLDAFKDSRYRQGRKIRS